MNLVLSVANIAEWYYLTAWRDLFNLWLNLLWFIYHFFSFPLLFKTLLAPWRRLREEHQRYESWENWFSALLVNLIMRVVGMIIRLVTIIIGLFTGFCLLGAGFFACLFWLILPLAIILIFLVGLKTVLS